MFDVNVLIALLDTDHVGHAVATSWFATHLEHGWASCPITENGTARIMASTGYPNPLPVAAILQRLAMAKATEYYRFWPDDVSLTDAEVFSSGELLGPKQITDRYLLALAVRNNGRLVTFDQGIRPTAVVGATMEHLVQLAG
ncbi:MAG TPA: TA system VapC family ribonuclease toxin [Steroidobacter sp.]